MTGSKAGKKEKGRFEEITALLVSVGFTAIIFLAAILLSDELAQYVAKGLSISARVIIPSIFPFLILSDLAVRYIHLERVGFLRRIFERTFRINGAALPVFVCGALCGFPIGAKLAIVMYDDGKISKCECERLIAFSNNASPGYVICAVGVGMLGNLHDGILLYAAMILSSIFTGIIIGANKHNSSNSIFIYEQNYSFAESVKSATGVCLHVAGFVTVFSIVTGAVDFLIDSEVVKSLVIPFLEIGNATVDLSDLYIYPRYITLTLIAFSISFSGLCVSAQVMSLIGKESDISMRRYVPRKILQGCIAAIIILLISIIKGP